MNARRRVLGEDPELRRSQILGHAIQLVGERGSGGLRIQELAERCGLSNAGLLYYFGSREELVLQMIKELERRETAAIEPFARAAERELEQGKPSKRTLVELLHLIVVSAMEYAELSLPALVLQAEAQERSHPAYDYFHRLDKMFLDLFTRLVAPHVEHPSSTARQLLALMIGLRQQWVGSQRSFDFVVEWDRAVAAVLGGPAASTAGATRGKGASRPRRNRTLHRK